VSFSVISSINNEELHPFDWAGTELEVIPHLRAGVLLTPAAKEKTVIRDHVDYVDHVDHVDHTLYFQSYKSTHCIPPSSVLYKLGNVTLVAALPPFHNFNDP
jgi:hypothetical protein